ncbi:RHS repeat-associated core domain-containing protein [Sinomicrobium soli]|uniref:RHS repeat-associated core domain-containing protein n=1 Tax=Sinomicrobium sp. N-1-3-6 TaxID=2219864 RepID=UPI001F238F45|nr:RHS repeat-associated core domain-containing protein [Sinomicrobium sp. N-1-3-6]
MDRGYTGHEHLAGVGLVHMNGRLYDPVLHRFLMPDNFVQDPYSTQNFNRYGYVLNNPLMYIDQNGEFFFVAALIGAAIGAITQAIKPGANFGKILGGALIGAASGAIGAGVGNVVSGGAFFGSQVAVTIGFAHGFASGFAGGFAGGFIGAAGNSWLDGASFGAGLGAGLKGGLMGGAIGGVVNGTISGIRANKSGLNFWDGKSLSKRTIGFMKASGFNPDSSIDPTDANLIKAREEWIPDAPMENVRNFTTENVPENMQKLMDSNGAAAATPALQKGGVFTGRSDMYFNKNLAFSSAKELYYTMVHEFNHVSQHALLRGLSVSDFSSSLFGHVKEFTAYSHVSSLGSTNYGGYGAGGPFSHLIPKIVSHPYYSAFQPQNYSWVKTLNFTNIKF